MHGVSLDDLFVDWLQSYPSAFRHLFYRDGIVNEAVYARQKPRLLFILAEPNGTKRNYASGEDPDLRRIFGERGLGKSIDLNLARWSAVVLDHTLKFFTPSREAARDALQRIAVMNLKKLAGGGLANLEAISVQAWRDRAFIRREVELIQPSVILTCGRTASRLFPWIVTDDELSALKPDSIWRLGRVPVLQVNHPSVRPKDAGRAFSRVVDRVLELQ
jgi:hypothetical protein